MSASLALSYRSGEKGKLSGSGGGLSRRLDDGACELEETRLVGDFLLVFVVGVLGSRC